MVFFFIGEEAVEKPRVARAMDHEMVQSGVELWSGIRSRYVTLLIGGSLSAVPVRYSPAVSPRQP